MRLYTQLDMKILATYKTTNVIVQAEQTVNGNLRVNEIIESLTNKKQSGLINKLQKAGQASIQRIGKFPADFTEMLKSTTKEDIANAYMVSKKSALKFATTEQIKQIEALVSTKLVPQQIELRDVLVAKFGYTEAKAVKTPTKRGAKVTEEQTEQPATATQAV